MALIKVSELSSTSSVKIDDILLVSTTSGSGYTSNHISIGDLLSSQPFIDLSSSATSGSSGTSGLNGSSGTSGINGTSGTSGSDGTSGTSGNSGSSGTSGTSGLSGTNGSSGTSGSSGSSGTSGDSIFVQSGSLYYTTSSILINNNLEISGTTTLGGNIVPASPRGATLGTLERPFSEIFVSSGSINIEGVVGQPNTTLSNVSGNILISAGGMQLVGSGAFNATTGSFQFISGSLEHIGDYTQTGNYVMNGNKIITGSLNISGSVNLKGLSTGSTSDNLVTINPTTKVVGSITGLTPSQIPTRYYGAFYDLTTQTGATNVSQSVQLRNTQHSNGVSIVSGSRVTVDNVGVYNLQFSIQLYRSSGGSVVNTYFWFRINGINVTNSNTAVTTNANNGYTVASWNYVDVFNAGDYIELMWMADGSNVELSYIVTPTGLPSIPSVILTLTQV